MKSILSTLIFLLILFLSFSFFSFLRPAPAWATACCLSGQYIKNGFGEGCCVANCVASLPSFDNSKYQCGINTCDAGSQQCTQNPIATDPTCQPGYVTPQPLFLGVSCENEIQGRCCKESGFKLGYCEDIGFVLSCNDYKIIKNWAPKTYCSDTKTRYDSVSKKCIQFTESSWNLEKTCLDGKGVETGIGCIPVDNLQGFLEFVLKWAFFASGGIIVLMVIATGYTLMTSQGNPEKLQAAKENIVALFSGLILIAFSLVLLQTIGADILKLPTF